MIEENKNGYELDWDGQIERDGADFEPLPDGEYAFVVSKFERGRYTPREGARLPPCNMAVLYLDFDGGAAGSRTIKHNLYLHSSTEGLLCSFFAAIGHRKHGQRISMNWSAVPGASGRAKLKTRRYKTKDGEERSINEVSRFLDYIPPVGTAAGGTQQSVTLPVYEPGRF